MSDAIDIVTRLRSGIGPQWSDDRAMARLLAEAAHEIELLRALAAERDAMRAVWRLPSSCPAIWLEALANVSQEHDEINRMPGREGERLRVLRIYDLLGTMQDNAASALSRAKGAAS